MQENISLVSFSSRLASQIWSEMQSDFFCQVSSSAILLNDLSNHQRQFLFKSQPQPYQGSNASHNAFREADTAAKPRFLQPVTKYQQQQIESTAATIINSKLLPSTTTIRATTLKIARRQREGNPRQITADGGVLAAEQSRTEGTGESCVRRNRPRRKEPLHR